MMKHVNQTTLLFFLAVATFTLSSCLRGGDPTAVRVARVAFLNAVPASEGLDIAVDNRLVNNPDSDHANFAYGDTLGYVNAFPGQRLVRVFEPERDATDEPLTHGAINLIPGESYTIYVAGYEDLALIATSDNLSVPAAGKAKVRFINLSPDAPSLSLGVSGEEELIGNDKEFEKYSAFVEIDGDNTYTFDITVHESGDVAHSFSLDIAEGGIYTIWAKGLYDETLPDADFGHGIMAYQTPPPATEE